MDRGGVCVVPVVPVTIYGSITLKSIEQENHFCGTVDVIYYSGVLNNSSVLYFMDAESMWNANVLRVYNPPWR